MMLAAQLLSSAGTYEDMRYVADKEDWVYFYVEDDRVVASSRVLLTLHWQRDDAESMVVGSLKWIRARPAKVPYTMSCEMSAGWPFESAHGRYEGYWRGEQARFESIEIERSRGYVRRTLGMTQVDFVYLPRWGGLAGNAVVYACAFIALWWSARVARHTWRGRRERCLSCGSRRDPDAAACEACGNAECPPGIRLLGLVIDDRGRCRRLRRTRENLRAALGQRPRGLIERARLRTYMHQLLFWGSPVLFFLLMWLLFMARAVIGLDENLAAFWIAVLLPAVIALLVALRSFFMIPLDRRRAHARLAICHACYYDLNRLTPEADRCTVCPECGAAWRIADAQPDAQPEAKTAVEVGEPPARDAP